MLESLTEHAELKTEAKTRRSEYEMCSIKTSDLEEELQEGWEPVPNKQGVRKSWVRRKKSESTILRDRVWNLLYGMGFEYLSIDDGICMHLDGRKPEGQSLNLDIVAVDEEVALAIICRSFKEPSEDPGFEDLVEQLQRTREQLTKAVRDEFTAEHKITVLRAVAIQNVQLTEVQKDYAKNRKVAILEESDLNYYESILKQMGPVSKYGLLADLLEGKSISGLEITVPALEHKLGHQRSYTFMIQPYYLLKIAYVSRRIKSRTAGLSTYQRMISKSRLREIRKFLSENKFFPTNIVINIGNPRHVSFMPSEKKKQTVKGEKFGWLTIKPSFRSAWIIDGQHRLFAYADHELALTSKIAVLAFVGLPVEKQAEMFIEINHKLKKVPPNLLYELYGDLHWDAEDPRDRAKAIASKAVVVLNADPDSPFYGRILFADEKGKGELRCITLQTLYTALMKTEFYVGKRTKKGIEFGAFWRDDPDASVERTVALVTSWFRTITASVEAWWSKGRADDGGGLAMNGPVAACIDVLRSVLVHLESAGFAPHEMSNEELLQAIDCYCHYIAEYLAAFSHADKLEFKKMLGSGGPARRRNMMQAAIHQRDSDFDPEGLQEFLEEERKRIDQEGWECFKRIERKLQDVLITKLKAEYQDDEDEDAWFRKGVPIKIQKKVTDKIIDDGSKLERFEEHFEFIHYRDIIQHNWSTFGQILGQGGNKENGTKWLSEVNNIRKNPAHPSKKKLISREEVELLVRHEQFLVMQSPKVTKSRIEN